MISQEIIIAEKEHLVNVLGKKLIDSNETDNSTSYSNRGYVKLAKKYWPEEFIGNRRVHVHHIDFDRTNNVVSNLVVLTPKEHKLIHKLFDPNYEEQVRKSAQSHIGLKGPWLGKNQSKESNIKRSNKLKGRPSPMKNRTQSMISRKRMSDSLKGKNKGKYRVYHPDGTYHMEKKEGLI